MIKKKSTLENVEALKVSDIIDFINNFLPLIVFIVGMIAFIMMVSAGISLSAAAQNGLPTSPGLNATAYFYRGMAFLSLAITVYISAKLLYIKKKNKL